MTPASPVIVAALLAMTTPASNAQTSLPSPRPVVPAPHADPGIVARPKASVIKPSDADPGMTKPAPEPGAGGVIAPPGTPGNAPGVVPK